MIPDDEEAFKVEEADDDDLVDRAPTSRSAFAAYFTAWTALAAAFGAVALSAAAAISVGSVISLDALLPLALPLVLLLVLPLVLPLPLAFGAPLSSPLLAVTGGSAESGGGAGPSSRKMCAGANAAD